MKLDKDDLHCYIDWVQCALRWGAHMVLNEIKMESIEAFNMKTAKPSDEFILHNSDVILTIL